MARPQKTPKTPKVPKNGSHKKLPPKEILANKLKRNISEEMVAQKIYAKEAQDPNLDVKDQASLAKISSQKAKPKGHCAAKSRRKRPKIHSQNLPLYTISANKRKLHNISGLQ